MPLPNESPKIFKSNYRGAKHYKWKGGIKTYNDGYIYVYKPDHYYCTNQGYIKRSRINYEEYYKCCLLKWSIIHHIDNDRSNDNPLNLKAFASQKRHVSHHMQGNQYGKRTDMDDRICFLCNSKDTCKRKTDGVKLWFNYKNEFICNRCNSKEYRKKIKGSK